ncbi:MAG: hypothetical protein IE920_09420 [Thiotrichales bacterium]|nr:hypothetical protein [Thiotrichales bacterium]
MNGYPKSFLLLLFSTTGLLYVSGLLLIPAMLIFRLQWEGSLLDTLMDSALVGGELRAALTFLHALFGWTLVWMIGAIWSIHMRSHWRRGENRKNGSLFTLIWFALIASALGIYYFGDEMLSQYSSMIHAVLGVLVPLLLWSHRRAGKKAVSNDRNTRSRGA